jgi:hypothetical protein
MNHCKERFRIYRDIQTLDDVTCRVYKALDETLATPWYDGHQIHAG